MHGPKNLVVDASVIVRSLFVLWSDGDIKNVTNQNEDAFREQTVVFKAILWLLGKGMKCNFS